MGLKWSIIAISALMLSSSIANAACLISPFRFYPAQNDSVLTTAAITDGSACTLRFRSLSTLVFDSASVVSRPSNGTLNKVGALEFVYRPKGGFRGSDKLSVKICGKGTSGAGCSTITYQITIN